MTCSCGYKFCERALEFLIGHAEHTHLATQASIAIAYTHTLRLKACSLLVRSVNFQEGELSKLNRSMDC